MVRYDLTYWFFSVAAGPPCIKNREASSLLFTWQENLSYQSPGGDITPHCLGVKLLSTVGLLLCRARWNHMENREPHLCHTKQRFLFPRCLFCGGFRHHNLQPRCGCGGDVARAHVRIRLCSSSEETTATSIGHATVMVKIGFFQSWGWSLRPTCLVPTSQKFSSDSPTVLCWSASWSLSSWQPGGRGGGGGAEWLGPGAVRRNRERQRKQSSSYFANLPANYFIFHLPGAFPQVSVSSPAASSYSRCQLSD